MKKNKVGIILSTFNGDKYLLRQLESLKAQTFNEFKVFIRDDGSSDETLNIVTNICKDDPRFVFVSTFPTNSLGPMRSFFELLCWVHRNQTQDYYFFCDQDDIWMPDKIEKYLANFAQLSNHGAVGLFSDLAIFSDNQLFHSSMRSYLGFAYPTDLWPSILVQNTVTGCTLALNSQAVEEIIPSLSLGGQFGLMHDHWIAAILSRSHALHFVPESLVLYRQHPQNASGGIGRASFCNKLKDLWAGKLKIRVFNIWRQFYALGFQSSATQKAPFAPDILRHKGFTFLIQLPSLGLYGQGILRTVLFWIGSTVWRQKILSQSAEWHHECSVLLSNQKKPEPSMDSQKT